MLVGLAAWVSWSVAYTIPDIRIGMTEQELEARLGKPDIRRQDVGRSGFGLYPAVPRWLLGRHDVYIVTYDADGWVASYDLFEHNFGRSHWTHH